MASYRFTYKSESVSEGRMLDDMTAVIREHRISRRLANRFMLAVSEAFTNALIHGNRRDPNKMISIDLDVNDLQIVADITDQGTGGLAKINRRQRPELLSENGRGVDLIRHYAHRADFRENDRGGLIVTICFDRAKLETKKTID